MCHGPDEGTIGTQMMHGHTGCDRHPKQKKIFRAPRLFRRPHPQLMHDHTGCDHHPKHKKHSFPKLFHTQPPHRSARSHRVCSHKIPLGIRFYTELISDMFGFVLKNEPETGTAEGKHNIPVPTRPSFQHKSPISTCLSWQISNKYLCILTSSVLTGYNIV